MERQLAFCIVVRLSQLWTNFDEFLEERGVAQGPIYYIFDGNPDHDPEPGFLDPDPESDPGLC